MDLGFSCRPLLLGWGKFLSSRLEHPLIASRYARLKVNYMTIPVYVVGAISLIIQVCYSDKVKRRGIFIIACCVPVAAGYLICVGTPNAGAGYAGMFVLVLGM